MQNGSKRHFVDEIKAEKLEVGIKEAFARRRRNKTVSLRLQTN